jgi:hypothetical protein
VLDGFPWQNIVNYALTKQDNKGGVHVLQKQGSRPPPSVAAAIAVLNNMCGIAPSAASVSLANGHPPGNATSTPVLHNEGCAGVGVIPRTGPGAFALAVLTAVRCHIAALRPQWLGTQ